MSYRGRGRGGFNNGFRNNNQNSMETDIDLAEVTIKNWNSAPKNDLISFINNKAHVQLRNVWVAPNQILHGFVLPQEVRTLENFNGIRFAGQSLSIRAKNPPPPSGGAGQGAGSTIDKLRNFLTPRYDPQSKMLSLTNMKSDPAIAALGQFTASKMFQALMKVAKDEMKLQVDTVDLSNNNLQDISTVTTLAQFFPNLKNLSLANNQISRLQNMDSWRHKFPYLRELILTGNRITNQPTYKDDMMKMFSRMIMLDGVVVRDEAQLATPKLPNPMKQSFFENPDVQNVSNGFLNSYFQLYDSDRSQLLQLYDDMSTLSVSVDNAAPRILNGAPPPWSAYIPMSRNLIKINSANARQTRLYIGTQTIANTLRRLPATKHDFSPEKFAIDVWRTSNIRANGDTGIVISLHGEFVEPSNSNSLRSFDRTFVLLQGSSGNMIVASDMITVRPYSGVDSWKEGTSPMGQCQAPPVAVAPASAQVPSPGVTPPELNGLNPDQIMIVQNLMQATKLNAQYARMCAEQAQFNPEQSMALFEQSRAQLPANAFMS